MRLARVNIIIEVFLRNFNFLRLHFMFQQFCLTVKLYYWLQVCKPLFWFQAEPSSGWLRAHPPAVASTSSAPAPGPSCTSCPWQRRSRPPTSYHPAAAPNVQLVAPAQAALNPPLPGLLDLPAEFLTHQYFEVLIKLFTKQVLWVELKKVTKKTESCDKFCI